MVVAALAGYLIGSIPFAVLIGRFRGVDPRYRGDRNAGWWNSRALMGEGPAFLVLVGDVLKGVVAAVVGGLIWGPWWTSFIAVFFAMVGHGLPLFARFRGGKSILTFVGGMLVLSTTAACIAIALCLVVAVATRKFEYGARLGVFAFPFIELFFDPFAFVVWTAVMLTFIGLRFFVADTGGPATAARA